MEGWLTWENALFAFAVWIAVTTLVGMMKSRHDSMVHEIRTKIEAERQRKIAEQLQAEREALRQEQIRRREEHLERIRSGRAAS